MMKKVQPVGLLILGSLFLSLLLSLFREEQFTLAFLNSLFLVSLGIFCLGLIFSLLQVGAWTRSISAFKLFFRHSGRLGSYILAQEDQDAGDKRKVKKSKGSRTLLITGALLVLVASTASLYYK